MEISAFGIVHKSLSTQNTMAMYRAVRTGSGRNQQYARARLHLAGMGRNAAKKPEVVDQQKKILSSTTRTSDGARAAGRKKVF
jgi:hypothetical protein